MRLAIAVAAGLIAPAASAMTIDQVTRAHELIEKIASDKAQIAQLAKFGVFDKGDYLLPFEYWGKDARLGNSLVKINIQLDSKQLLDALQSQLVDDESELSKLGITQ